MDCTAECRCGTIKKPCQNRVSLFKNQHYVNLVFLYESRNFNAVFVQATTRNSVERERDDRGKSRRGTRAQAKGFRLSSKQDSKNLESEDTIRKKEHKDVKVSLFIYLYT